MRYAARTHFEPREEIGERGLSQTLDWIEENGYEIEYVLPTYYGNGEVAYTIIYKERESND